MDKYIPTVIKPWVISPEQWVGQADFIEGFNGVSPGGEGATFEAWGG